jgi:hypothetical protein
VTDETIHAIAEDATHLLDALKGQEHNFPFCEAMVVAAMPAIVTANTRDKP